MSARLGRYAARRARRRPALRSRSASSAAPEAEVLAFVADQKPGLGLELVRFPERGSSAGGARSREVDAASFESQVEPRDLGTGVRERGAHRHLCRSPSYSRRPRSLSELGEGSRVAISRAPSGAGQSAPRALPLWSRRVRRSPRPLRALARRDEELSRIELVAVDDASLPAELDGAQLVALEYGLAAAAGLAPARRGLAMEDALLALCAGAHGAARRP